MRARTNRLTTAATAFLASVEGRKSADLSDIEYLALFGAKSALRAKTSNELWRDKNREREKAKTRAWVAANRKRKHLTDRMAFLRSAIKRLDGKPPSKSTDWPARRAAYELELAQREAEFSKLLEDDPK